MLSRMTWRRTAARSGVYALPAGAGRGRGRRVGRWRRRASGSSSVAAPVAMTRATRRGSAIAVTAVDESSEHARARARRGHRSPKRIEELDLDRKIRRGAAAEQSASASTPSSAAAFLDACARHGDVLDRRDAADRLVSRASGESRLGDDRHAPADRGDRGRHRPRRRSSTSRRAETCDGTRSRCASSPTSAELDAGARRGSGCTARAQARRARSRLRRLAAGRAPR